jgi:outer membrane protein assembly factor BamD (BamD/ComL family)
MSKPLRFARRFLPACLLALALSCKGIPPKDPPDQLLARGKQLLEKKDYKTAANYFIAVKQRHPESLQDEEASYLLGESKRLERYGGSAFKAYQDFAKRYPNSRYSVGAAEGEFLLGKAYFDKTLWGILFFKPDPAVGARVMEHMQSTYRNHARAPDALVLAGDYFISAKSWQDALIFYTRLLQEYPRSRHVLRARFQHARVLWEMNEGADYDERLLLDSRRGFRDFIASVAAEGKQEELAKQIAAAETSIGEIDGRLAQKFYRIGRFYERTKRPGSALFYYNHCVTSYPDSKYGKRAAERAGVLRKRGVVERPGLPAATAPPDKQA